MIYAIQLSDSYTRETLPKIKTVWDFIRFGGLLYDGGELQLSDDEWTEYDDLDHFKKSIAEDLSSDPFFLIVDVDKKTVDIFEVSPSVEISKVTMPGTSKKNIKTSKK